MDKVLSLGDLPERPGVEIFGTLYGLMSPQEQSMEENWQIGQYFKEQTARTDGEWSKEDVAAMAQRIKEICYLLVPDCPQDTIDRLTDGQRLILLQTWNRVFTLPAGSLNGLQPVATNSRRGSSASTAQRTRKAG